MLSQSDKFVYDDQTQGEILNVVSSHIPELPGNETRTAWEQVPGILIACGIRRRVIASKNYMRLGVQ